MLCTSCQHVFTAAAETHRDKINYRYNGVLQGSNANGCHFCLQRYHRLSEAELCELFESEHRIEYFFSIPERLLRFLFYLENDGLEHPYLPRIAKIDFKFVPVEEASHLASLDEVDPSTASSKTWTTVKQFHDQCVQRHGKCSPPTGDTVSFAPSRLVDLGLGLKPTLRLAERDVDYPAETGYYTLSHCWGKHRTLSLRVENIDEMRQAIPAIAMSRTFDDAAHIVKRLGGRYIWIDSLCIIQNSHGGQDWLNESAAMHLIYRNAVCNVSATAAADGRVGCFFDREPLLVNPLEVELHLDGLSPRNVYIIDSDLWTRALEDAPLAKRAWVIQERFLSPRILHFGRDQIFWECRELKACEMFPRGMPLGLMSSSSANIRDITPDTDGAVLRRNNGFEPHPVLNAYQIWDQMVLAYTRASLTEQSDKFVALMGLAKHMQTYLNDQYLAGLWRKYFAAQLCWMTGSGGQRSEAYVAPSWSWASWIGPVVHPCRISEADNNNILIDVVDVSVVNRGDDSMGPVVSGKARIRGTYVKGLINYQETQASDGRFLSCRLDIFGTNEGEIDYMPDPDVKYSEAIVYCVPIKRMTSGNDERLSGIMLEATHDGAAFRRFGSFTTRRLGIPENSHTTYHSKFSDRSIRAKGFEAPDSASESDKPRYLFDII